MDQSIKIAEDALRNPPASLQETLDGAPDEAKNALAELQQEQGETATGANEAHKTEGDGMDAKLQVVDDNQKFTTELTSHMSTWQLIEKGFSYDVVAVFGSQSTGKSTLLNRLFGTKFDVMNENERRQTTKGIWMSKGRDMSVLVMDVEGTDGRERGEDQDFERKSALFSIAVAEVLIVNIWEHQVGLYQGANMGLLKTVFEVNLALFLAAKTKGKAAGHSQDKTLLLFVIRDHIGATPLANLQNTLTQDLNRLWDGLSKPEGLENCRITDFFDLSFVTLAHKLLQPDKFEEEVIALRGRFNDSSNENYVFLPKYHKRIPADGISQYMSSVWDAVVTNKDLDLPTQQEMLAQFRCDEIASEAFNSFAEGIKTLTAGVGGRLTKGLGGQMGTAREVALTAFDTAASRYHSGVYTRKRAELLSKLNSALSPLFLSYLKLLHKSVLKEFRKAIQDGLKLDGYDFAAVVSSTRAAAQQEFDKGAAEITLSETEWSAEETKAQLEEDMSAVADLLRAEETKKCVAVVERNIKRAILEPVELSLNKPKKDMWDSILLAFKAALATGEEAYIKKAASFHCTEAENEAALASIRKKAWLGLVEKVKEQTSEAQLLARLKLLFEDKFRYDDEGVPRVWKPEDDIDSVFKKAKDYTLDLIPLYAKVSPSDEKAAFSLPESADPTDLDADFSFEDTLTLLSDTQTTALQARFRREADAYYLEAKRSMVSSISQIPVWMYGVLAVLGWNEFVAVLRNPIYFTFLLIAAAGAAVTIQLGMTGPVLAMARGISNEIVRTVNDQLRTYFAEQPHPQERVKVPVPMQATSTASEPEEIELSEKPARKAEKKEKIE